MCVRHGKLLNDSQMKLFVLGWIGAIVLLCSFFKVNSCPEGSQDFHFKES